MVSVLVGQDVRLRVAALGTELLLQLLEEAEVEVDALVGRAVERPDLGAGPTAAGVDVVGEEGHPRWPVLGVAELAGGELCGPDLVGLVVDLHQVAVVVLLDGSLGAHRSARSLCATDPGWPPRDSGVELRHVEGAGWKAAPAAQQGDEQHDDEAHETGSAADGHAGAAAASSEVVDARGVDAAVLEAHGAPSVRSIPRVGRSQTSEPDALTMCYFGRTWYRCVRGVRASAEQHARGRRSEPCAAIAEVTCRCHVPWPSAVSRERSAAQARGADDAERPLTLSAVRRPSVELPTSADPSVTESVIDLGEPHRAGSTGGTHA